ncbi:MAG TPA: PilZ domain-containing protein [Phycisphaerae bacterium]|nr:PilZ domain-containing protein [Phycisphaerae bacterium]
MSEARGIESDRRKFQRAVIGMPVRAVLGDAVPDDPRRIVGLRVLNVSRGGVSATSQEALSPSQPLTLFFPPVGSGKGRDTRGQVVRCDDLGGHYSVGIAFEAPWPDPDEISATSRRFS